MNLNENNRVYQLTLGTTKVIRFKKLEDLQEYLEKNGCKNELLQIIDIVTTNDNIETGRVMLDVQISN